MSGPAGLRVDAAPNPGGATRVVFTLGGERFALPIASIEAVGAPPPLVRVPHASPALLGAGHLGGRIIPIVDLGRLLGRERARWYDGSGEIVRLRTAGGSIGLWVDKVERVMVFEAGPKNWLGVADEGSATLIDPASLLRDGLDAPALASVAPAPLGEVADRAEAAPAAPPAQSFIVVEAGGKPIPLPRHAVLELIDAVAWTPVPRAPDGLLGVGLLREAALPVLSLAALLGLDRDAPPGGFAAIEVGGRRALLAVDRIVGLRSEPAEAVDVAAAIADELRRVILGFSPIDEERPAAALVGDVREYLAFTVSGQDCAVAAGCVERIVGPQNLIKLPRPPGEDSGEGHPPRLEGAIELRGQIVPVAALRSRLGLSRDPEQNASPEPNAYVILRDAAGLGAIGVEQAKQLVRLRAADIVPTPADDRSAIAGIVAWGDAGGLLRIVAADRLWDGP